MPGCCRSENVPYIASIGHAEGSIIAAIMTAHIVHNSRRCLPSQTLVIIQTDGPAIEPYMSRVMATIHHHESSRTATTIAGNAVRLLRTPPGKRRVLSVVQAADVVPREAERVDVAL